MQPNSLKALAGRLRQVADLYPSRDAASAAAGVSRPQLSRYLNGTTKIPLVVAVRLAEPFQISIDWIASGRGEMFGNADSPQEALARARTTRITQNVDRLLRRDGLSLPPERRRNLVKAIVEMEVRDGGDGAEIDLDRYSEVIRLVAKG